MRINPNIGMQNGFLNVYRINQDLNQNSYALKNNQQHERKDTLSISPLRKTNSFIESLMKQKQDVIERKNELIGNTLEKGRDMDSIKSQLESYEEQLKTIDERIAQIMAEQAKQQAEKQKETKNAKPKTEEEIPAETERLNSIISLSPPPKQAQVISSVKTKVDGDARVLKSEIELDKARAGSSPSAKEFIANKDTRLTEMQKLSANLTVQIGDKLVEVNEEIKKNGNNQTVKLEKPNTTENSALIVEAKSANQPGAKDRKKQMQFATGSDLTGLHG
jgi:hypothetical protein